MSFRENSVRGEWSVPIFVGEHSVVVGVHVLSGSYRAGSAGSSRPRCAGHLPRAHGRVFEPAFPGLAVHQ